MTNARGPQRSEDRSVTDADREVAYTLDALIGTVFNSPSNEQIIGWCTTYIARARADADEAGYSRGLREGAASEREACAKVCNEMAAEFYVEAGEWRKDGMGNMARLAHDYAEASTKCAAAIRARSEGGKA